MAKHLANDGQYYSDEQYTQAAELVKAHLVKKPLSCSRWWITGAITGYTHDDKPYEYYMRDLVLGIVREDGYEDYREAVRAAGIVYSEGGGEAA